MTHPRGKRFRVKHERPTINRTSTNMTRLCCEMMTSYLNAKCSQHGTTCPDNVVQRGDLSGRLSLVALAATYTFTFCPWCGTKVQEPEPDDVGDDV